MIVALHAGPGGRQLAAARANVAAAQRRVLRRGAGSFRSVRRWRVVPALATTVGRVGLARLRASPDVAAVGLVARVHTDLAESVPLVRADVAQARGLTGKGVTVAVIDTGVDTANADLADDIVAQGCFIIRAGGAGGCSNGSARQIGQGAAQDETGHGTRVASIITGKGGASTAKGIAPDAKIVAAKIFDSDGTGSSESILSALDWIINDRPEVRIVNMSLGGSERFAQACDRERAYAIADASALGALRARGVITFAASGNVGISTGIEEPACIAGVVSVGAVYDAAVGRQSYNACTDETTAADSVACFSNAAPILDLLAPGARITTAALGGGSVTGAGTSFATPHAAGVAALLLQARPDLTPAQVESTLKTTGVPILDPRTMRTFPRVDAVSALDAVGALPRETPAGPLDGSVTFADAVGDAPGGPDVGGLEISSAGGRLTVRVPIPNRTSLGDQESIQVAFDVDRNAATGDSAGSDAALVGAGKVVQLQRWSSDGWTAIRRLYDASVGDGALVARISQAELGSTADFDVRVLTWAGPPPGLRDAAPDSGSWFFPAYSLTVERSGSGSGTVTGGGLSCGTSCSGSYRRATMATLHAEPGPGSVFTGWSGACSGQGPCTVTMDAGKTVRASFEVLRRLEVTRSGRGTGRVTSRPAGIACGDTCDAEFADGTSVVLNAHAGTGSRFGGWTGACAGDRCDMAMTEDRGATARFDDVAAPSARALAAAARRGRPVRLRFRLSDNSGTARATVTVLGAAKRLKTLRRPLGPAKGAVYGVSWKVPRRLGLRGVRFCVVAVDASGNRSPKRCAPLRVRG